MTRETTEETTEETTQEITEAAITSTTLLRVNGVERKLDVDPAKPLLWVLREDLELTGTKFGCGIAQCGACTVRVDGRATRSCVTPVSAVAGRDIQTIESLANSDGQPHPLQTAWIQLQVPQCGYCQSGQLMTAAALLETNPNPSDEEIDTAMDGNICRCGMYGRIKDAIKSAAQANFGGARAESMDDPVDDRTGEEATRG